MGTRGTWGFVLDGQEYLTYVHFDSYPTGLGSDLLAWAQGADWAVVREQVRALRLVNDTDTPDAEELTHFAASHDRNVSSGADWYSLLRGNQGDPAATLASGVMADGHEFPLDSLFCEWAYVFDLDQNRFEAYRGFQTSLTSEGRWANRPTPEEDAAKHAGHLAWCEKNNREPWQREVSEYKAVALMAWWSLDALPTSEQMCAVVDDDE